MIVGSTLSNFCLEHICIYGFSVPFRVTSFWPVASAAIAWPASDANWQESQDYVKASCMTLPAAGLRMLDCMHVWFLMPDLMP